jgi:hypothetical protein
MGRYAFISAMRKVRIDGSPVTGWHSHVFRIWIAPFLNGVRYMGDDKGDRRDSTIAGLLVAMAILSLTQPASDWYEGKPLPHLRTAISVAIAVFVIFLATYPYLFELGRSWRLMRCNLLACSSVFPLSM